MAQTSWPWSTVAALGDGAVTLNEDKSRDFLARWFGVQNPAVEGVSKGVGGELAVSGVASPLTVQSGSAICYGLYINDAAASTPAIATPGVGTTGGRVVLQTNWAGTGGAGLEARTRIAVKKSADGVAAIPALTQTPGVTWEISLATFTITTGGVIAPTDARNFRKSTMVVDAAELVALSVTTPKLALLAVTSAIIAANAVIAGKLADGAVDTTARIANNIVTAAKMFQLAGLSILGRSANTTGDMAAITAANDGEVLKRSGTSLVFGKIADANVTAEGLTKASMLNRTRTFMLPPFAMYSGMLGSDPALSGSGDGVQFEDGALSQGSVNFVVPKDFVSTLTVAPVVRAAAAGNLRWNMQIYHEADGGDLGVAGSPASAATTTFGINDVKVLTPLAIPAAAVDHIVTALFSRDGLNGADTLTGSIILMGFLVSYTADM